MAIDYSLTVSQTLNFGSVSSIRNLDQKTICGWLNIDTASISEIVNLSPAITGTDEQFVVLFRSDSGIKLSILYYFSGTDGQWETASAWGTGLHHFAITYDKSSISNKPTFYKDGLSVSRTDVSTPTGSADSGTNNTLYVGSAGIAPSIDGRLQDLRIYNRILTAAEIAALAGSSRTIEMNDNGLVFHAPLMYAANRYPTIPFAGTLEATDYTYDRINGYQGTPSGSPSGAADMVYGTGF